MTLRRRIIAALGLALIAWLGVSTIGSPVVIGAVYPIGGSQGAGGTEEYRGVGLAAAYANRRGGVHGHPIRLRLEDAESWDAAPGAVERLASGGATVVVGSYGSTISRPAAETASRLGLVFWETGAVCQLSMEATAGGHVYRVAPTGAALGRAAAAFVRDQLAPRLRRAQPLRYAVAYVDDVYGRAVGGGAIAEIRASRLPMAATFPYTLRRLDYDALAANIARARPDVLMVAAYLEDGVALRRSLVRARVPLVASIGTSSSYCMPAFGQMLGRQAVGLFASDKPDGDDLQPDRLLPGAAGELRWATAEYRRRYGEPMTAPALAGSAGGLALFEHVLPRSHGFSAEAVARAARTVHLPEGALPNGSGLAFAPPGTPDAGTNLKAASVIWEWMPCSATSCLTRVVVWPPAFATHPIVFP